jgi:peptidoglycan hydrolase-like protein with peptidoglycan-binding domain
VHTINKIMLKKSNAFKFLIGTLAVFALAFALNVSAAMDFGSATLKVGSKGEYVKTLQTLVGASPVDGIFGNGTKAKVMAWQANNGLTADGVFGNMSKAKANSMSGSYPAGCTSATGFSSTTGMPCSSGSTVPGCAVGAMYSSTTGQLCSGGTTVVNQGTNGYLADIASDSTNRVSTVYESEQGKVVAGFRATARLSSQNVTRVRVAMRNTDTGGSSVTLSKYISGASLWYGSTKLATMSVAQADRSTSDDTYTFNFSGLNANIAQDQIGRFYVSVDVNGALDTNDATNANWAVTFPDGGLSSSSPDGSYDTYNASAGNVGTLSGSNVGFTFGKFSANGVKATVGLATSNPNAAIIGVNSTSATNNVTLLKFTVKATNSDLTLRKIPVQIVSSGSAAYVTSMINTIKIYNGSNILDSLDGSAGATVSGSITGASASCSATGTTCGYLFSNLSTPYNKVMSGTTAEFSVVVDLKSQTAGSYSDGATLTANVQNADVILTANFGVNDVNGDTLTAGSTYRQGSALGTVQSLYVNGVNAVMGAAATSVTTASAGDITSVSYSIPLSITAFGNDAYIGQAAQLIATASGSNAVAFVFQNAAGSYADETSSTAAYTIVSDDATANPLGTGFILPSGSTKHFHVNVTLSGPTTANTYYRVQLKQIRTFTDAGLGLGAANTNLLPVDAFRTNSVYINN